MKKKIFFLLILHLSILSGGCSRKFVKRISEEIRKDNQIKYGNAYADKMFTERHNLWQAYKGKIDFFLRKDTFYVLQSKDAESGVFYFSFFSQDSLLNFKGYRNDYLLFPNVNREMSNMISLIRRWDTTSIIELSNNPNHVLFHKKLVNCNRVILSKKKYTIESLYFKEFIKGIIDF
jgi:hypothetical protein